VIRWNCGIISLAVALLLGSAIAIPIGAQTGSVSLEGSVRDPSGNPLPDSVLTAVETDGGYQLEAVSDSEGQYRFPALPPGIYDVTAKAKGYKDVVHRRIFLFSPGSTVENFVFEVSAIDR
jgi:protocatechuate 3,4-dioxygenase beta subunit